MIGVGVGVEYPFDFQPFAGGEIEDLLRRLKAGACISWVKILHNINQRGLLRGLVDSKVLDAAGVFLIKPDHTG